MREVERGEKGVRGEALDGGEKERRRKKKIGGVVGGKPSEGFGEGLRVTGHILGEPHVNEWKVRRFTAKDAIIKA